MNRNKSIIKSLAKELKKTDKQRETISYSLACAIRDFRKSLDISLREMARRLKISAAYLSDIELGRRSLSERMLKKIISF